MRQEFERLVAKWWIDLPYANMISPETQEAVGIALLWNAYKDKAAFKAILKRVEWFEEAFNESEKTELLAKISELWVKLKEAETKITETETIIAEQTEALKNTDSTNDEDINKVIEAKDKEIADIKKTSDETLKEFKKVILENEELKHKLATIEWIADDDKEEEKKEEVKEETPKVEEETKEEVKKEETKKEEAQDSTKNNK
jgi:hypothetical protein